MNTSFLTVLDHETATLQAQFPHLSDRLSRAKTLLETGRMFVEESGTEAMVTSKDGTQYWHVNGNCDCPASTHRREACYHRLALRVYEKVVERLAHEEECYTLNLDGDVIESAAAPAIRPEWLVSVQGKPFIRFEGLLELAHARGLVSLETVVVQASEAMCICQATATFADGRRFTDIGDETERNVAKHLDIHYIRMAATRASARALRRALNISACSVEELSGEEVTA